MEEPRNGIPYVRHYRLRKWVWFSVELNFPPVRRSGTAEKNYRRTDAELHEVSGHRGPSDTRYKARCSQLLPAREHNHGKLVQALKTPTSTPTNS